MASGYYTGQHNTKVLTFGRWDVSSEKVAYTSDFIYLKKIKRGNVIMGNYLSPDLRFSLLRNLYVRLMLT